jgi:hypothetical protein
MKINFKYNNGRHTAPRARRLRHKTRDASFSR